MNKNLQVGPAFPRLIGELAAIHAGQADVGHQQIDPLLGAQDPQARRSIDGLVRPVALFGEHLQDHAAHHRFILDHQHGLAGGGMFGRLERPASC